MNVLSGSLHHPTKSSAQMLAEDNMEHRSIILKFTADESSGMQVCF